MPFSATEIMFFPYRTLTGHLNHKNNKLMAEYANAQTTGAIRVRTIIHYLLGLLVHPRGLISDEIISIRYYCLATHWTYRGDFVVVRSMCGA